MPLPCHFVHKLMQSWYNAHWNSTQMHTHTHKYLYAQIPKKRRKPTQILTVTSVSTPKCCSVISLLALLNRNFSSMTPCVSECLCQSFLSFFFFFLANVCTADFWLILRDFCVSLSWWPTFAKLIQMKTSVAKLTNDYSLFAQIMAKCFGFTKGNWKLHNNA